MKPARTGWTRAAALAWLTRTVGSGGSGVRREGGMRWSWPGSGSGVGTSTISTGRGGSGICVAWIGSSS
jgi:hypothetical protein